MGPGGVQRPADVYLRHITARVVRADDHLLPEPLEDTGLLVDPDMTSVIGEEGSGGYLEDAVQRAAPVILTLRLLKGKNLGGGARLGDYRIRAEWLPMLRVSLT